MSYTKAREEIVDNFYRVRRMLGILGFLLPFLLIVVGVGFGYAEPSLSDYYHTLLRDIFVGILTAIGVFLICYTGFRRGPDEPVSDDVLTTIAGVAALVVAFVPNRGTLNQSLEPEALAQYVFGVAVSDYTHHLAAGTFLLSTAFLCRYKFARTAKPARRRVYLGCFWVIIAATLATTGAAALRKMGTPAQHDFVVGYQLVFWFEAVGVWAFSLAWLVKGRADRALIRAARSGGSAAS